MATPNIRILYPDLGRDQARAVVRRIEQDPKHLAHVILNRRTHPDWQLLKDAYRWLGEYNPFYV